MSVTLSPEFVERMVSIVNSRGAVFDPVYDYAGHQVGGSDQRHYWLYLLVNTQGSQAAWTQKGPRGWTTELDKFEDLVRDICGHIERNIAH